MDILHKAVMAETKLMSVEIGRTRFDKYSEGKFNRVQQKFGYMRILVWVY